MTPGAEREGEAPSPSLSDARRTRRSFLTSGASQFAGQALGILIAVLVSHLIARRMGAGAEADAFLLARRVIMSVGEMLSQVVVFVAIPILAARAAAGEPARGTLTAGGGAAVAIGAVLALGFSVVAPVLVGAMSPRFDAQTAELAARVLTILAWSLPATVATIIFAAYCNVMGRFGVPAAVRQMPRAAVAAGLLLGTGALALQAAAAYAAATVAVAGLTLVLALRLRGERVASAEAPPSTPAARRRGIAAIVIAVGALAGIWLETAFAARQSVGTVAMLEFSQRLGALCGNTLAAALALVAFADLSRRSSETGAMSRRFGRAAVTSFALLAPLQIGVFVNAGAITDVVLAHGQMSAETASRVSTLVRWMAFAPVGALMARLLLVRVLADEKLPIIRLVGAAVALDFLCRLTLFAALVPRFGVEAMPIGLTLAPVVAGTWLLIALRRRGSFGWREAAWSCRSTLASSAVGSAAVVAGAALGPVAAEALGVAVDGGSKLASAGQLATSGLLGGLALAVAVKLFGVRLRAV